MTGRLSRRGSPPPSCGGRDASQRLVHDEIGTWEERALFYQVITFMCIMMALHWLVAFPGPDMARAGSQSLRNLGSAIALEVAHLEYRALACRQQIEQALHTDLSSLLCCFRSCLLRERLI